MPYRIVLSPLTRVILPQSLSDENRKVKRSLPFLQIVHALGEANSPGFLAWHAPELGRTPNPLRVKAHGDQIPTPHDFRPVSSDPIAGLGSFAVIRAASRRLNRFMAAVNRMPQPPGGLRRHLEAPFAQESPLVFRQRREKVIHVLGLENVRILDPDSNAGIIAGTEVFPGWIPCRGGHRSRPTSKPNLAEGKIQVVKAHDDSVRSRPVRRAHNATTPPERFI